MKLLIDENISPKIKEHLSEHDLKFVRDESLGAKDEEVTQLALKEDRVIITQDDDFGQIYYFSKPEIRILVAKPDKQNLEKINSLVQTGLNHLEDEEKGLFIVSKDEVRVTK